MNIGREELLDMFGDVWVSLYSFHWQDGLMFNAKDVKDYNFKGVKDIFVKFSKNSMYDANYSIDELVSLWNYQYCLVYAKVIDINGNVLFTFEDDTKD